MKRKIPHVFETTMHGTKCWVMDGRYHGEKREYFPTKAEAQGRAETLFNKIFNPDLKIETLPPDVMFDAKRGLDLLKPYGGNLLKACEFYAEHLNRQAKPLPTIQEASEKWKLYKAKEKISEETLRGHKYRLKKFCELHGKTRVDQFTHTIAHSWLHDLDGSTWTKLDYRKTLLEFFEWCIFPQHWISSNPIRRVKFRIGEIEVSIFSVQEAMKVYHTACASDPDIKRFVTVCMFAGLRPEAEAMKLKREDIRETGDIRVQSSKTSQFRYVRMENGVKNALLSPKWEGPMISGNWRRRWEQFLEKAGFRIRDKNPNGMKWPHDVMRHTYCSYHLAFFQNEALTAHLAGHDVKVLRKNYRRPIPKSEGKKFWEIIA